MAEITQVGKVALVNYTTAEWETETRVPFKGCPCVEFTPDGKTIMKIGDGVNLYTDLPPVSEELTFALIIKALGYTPLDAAKLGIAEGAASLDASGKIPAVQLPSFVNEVVNVGLYISIDADGNKTIIKAVDKDGADIVPETEKIYVNAYANKVTIEGGEETEQPATEMTYRWSGTLYVEISASDIVTPSDKNGYIKINGTDVKVFDPADIEAELKNKIDKSDTLILNCTL